MPQYTVRFRYIVGLDQSVSDSATPIRDMLDIPVPSPDFASCYFDMESYALCELTMRQAVEPKMGIDPLRLPLHRSEKIEWLLAEAAEETPVVLAEESRARPIVDPFEDDSKAAANMTTGRGVSATGKAKKGSKGSGNTSNGSTAATTPQSLDSAIQRRGSPAGNLDAVSMPHVPNGREPLSPLNARDVGANDRALLLNLTGGMGTEESNTRSRSRLGDDRSGYECNAGMSCGTGSALTLASTTCIFAYDVYLYSEWLARNAFLDASVVEGILTGASRDPASEDQGDALASRKSMWVRRMGQASVSLTGVVSAYEAFVAAAEQLLLADEADAPYGDSYVQDGNGIKYGPSWELSLNAVMLLRRFLFGGIRMNAEKGTGASLSDGLLLLRPRLRLSVLSPDGIHGAVLDYVSNRSSTKVETSGVGTVDEASGDDSGYESVGDSASALPTEAATNSGMCDGMVQSELTSLSTLILPSSSVSRVDFGQTLRNLTHLILPFNHISCLGALSSLPQLQVLDVRYNCLVDFGAWRGAISSLTEIALDCNKISSLAQLQRLSTLAPNVISLSALSNPVVNDRRYRRCVVASLAKLEMLDTVPICEAEEKLCRRSSSLSSIEALDDVMQADQGQYERVSSLLDQLNVFPTGDSWLEDVALPISVGECGGVSGRFVSDVMDASEENGLERRHALGSNMLLLSAAPCYSANNYIGLCEDRTWGLLAGCTRSGSIHSSAQDVKSDKNCDVRRLWTTNRSVVPSSQQLVGVPVSACCGRSTITRGARGRYDDEGGPPPRSRSGMEARMKTGVSGSLAHATVGSVWHSEEATPRASAIAASISGQDAESGDASARSASRLTAELKAFLPSGKERRWMSSSHVSVCLSCSSSSLDRVSLDPRALLSILLVPAPCAIYSSVGKSRGFGAYGSHPGAHDLLCEAPTLASGASVTCLGRYDTLCCTYKPFVMTDGWRQSCLSGHGEYAGIVGDVEDALGRIANSGAKPGSRGSAYATARCLRICGGGDIGRLGVLSHFPALRVLVLTGIGLTSLSSLSECSQLRILDASSNFLTKGPAVTGLSRLVCMNVSDNLLTDLAFVTDVPSLRRLSAGCNQISDISCLKRLSSLRELYVGGNRIMSSEDVHPLTSLTRLSVLDLRMNAVCHCFAGETTGNALMAPDGPGTTPTNSTDSMPLGISAVHSRARADPTRFFRLFAIFRFSSVVVLNGIPVTVAEVHESQSLFASSPTLDRIADMVSTYEFATLRVLDLSKGGFEDVDCLATTTWPCLRTVILDNNSIMSLKPLEAMGGKILDLSVKDNNLGAQFARVCGRTDNGRSGSSIPSPALSSSASLSGGAGVGTTVAKSPVARPNLAAMIMPRLRYVRKVDLSSNEIAYLPCVTSLGLGVGPNAWTPNATDRQAQALFSVYASTDYRGTIPNVRVHTRRRATASLDDVDETCVPYPCLQELSLADNMLSGLPYFLCGLRALRVLRLDSNQIKGLQDSWFSGLVSLESLSLECNAIRTLSSLAVVGSTLKELRLAHNRLMDVTDVQVLKCRKVRRLTISCNPFSRNRFYRVMVVRYLPHVQVLDGTPVTDEERAHARELEDEAAMAALERAALVAPAPANRVELRITTVNFGDEGLDFGDKKVSPYGAVSIGGSRSAGSGGASFHHVGGHDQGGGRPMLPSISGQGARNVSAMVSPVVAGANMVVGVGRDVRRQGGRQMRRASDSPMAGVSGMPVNNRRYRGSGPSTEGVTVMRRNRSRNWGSESSIVTSVAGARRSSIQRRP